HGCINNGKIFGLGVLQVFDCGQQHSGVTHQRAPWLEHNLQVIKAPTLQTLEDLVEQHRRRKWCFIGVTNANAAAQVEVTNMDTQVGEFGNKHQQFIERIEVGADFGNLRANVTIDTDNIKTAIGQCALVHGGRIFNGNTKFVFF